MSIKSQGRRIGRMIRRVTGIHLPVAMKIGKMIVRNKPIAEIVARFPDCVSSKEQENNCRCCAGIFDSVFKGKRGSLTIQHYGIYVAEYHIMKEFFIQR